MILTETTLAGAWTIDIEPIGDERGYFARWYCANEFGAQGLETSWVQGNLSHNVHAGTIRGMHLQVPPAAEAKLVRCITGAVYDVIVDARPGSPTRWEWFGVELSAENRRALYVPPGFFHGYQALEDGADVLYQVSAFYSPGTEMGLRYDDPRLGLVWPLPADSVSEKDLGWPLLDDLDLEPLEQFS